MRRTTLTLLAALTMLTGCLSYGAVGVGTNSGVGVGVGTASGMGVSLSSYGDFLHSGPDAAYRINREGFRAFLDGDYPTARTHFDATLDQYPGNPDAVFYLGLTLMFLDELDQGFAVLATYREPFNTRITQEVRWWTGYCRKRPDMTPETIRKTLVRARAEGLARERQERWEDRRGL
ncbi:tetratricopeptide repeat protein [Pseudodesulfovibrio pelocollis]|uniref:tetratricopeptide repeat protein n=1 Tax=Pseudodesulfovibrio pelocollis TaxID=3051432 RepID=UPI00255B046F|nr:tetratricopeptide repeat protein [Pseudodesulfovibrio sp. SB368]